MTIYKTKMCKKTNYVNMWYHIFLEIINENIYIVQANGGTKENRETNLAAAKTYLKGDTFPITGLSDVTCY